MENRMTKKELQTKLTEMGIQFKAKASVKELAELLAKAEADAKAEKSNKKTGPKSASLHDAITTDVQNLKDFATESINKKGHHIVKMKVNDRQYTFKVCPLVKENRYRVFCSASVIEKLKLEASDYEYHAGWAVKYTLNTMTLKDVLTKLQAA